jgi:uncharacterized protein (DUF2236 family)
VHATLLEAYVVGHAQFGRPMSRDERERFYREYRGLGRLIGVRDRDLPRDWSGFRAYFDDMVHAKLVRTESVDRVLHAVRGAVPPPVPLPELLWRAVRMPARRALWLGGIGLMAPSLRERLGVRWTRRDEAAFRALGSLTRRLTPVMPEELQIVGPDHLRWRARAIASGPLGSDRC